MDMKDSDERVQKLINDFESGKIKEENLTENEAALLSFVYQLKIIDVEDEIRRQKIEIQDYKARLKNAIEYLKNKNNNANSFQV